ncbi:MAG: DoxX family protein [Opitutales bacterium]
MKINVLCSWLLQVAVALIIARFGVDKWVGATTSVELFASLKMEPAGRYLVGSLELLAALLLLIPTGIAWGALLAWGLMSGALIAHLTRLGMEGPMLVMTALAGFNWLASATILILHKDQIEFVRSMLARGNDQHDPDISRNPRN